VEAVPAWGEEERTFLLQLRIDAIRLRLGQIPISDRLAQAGFGCCERCVDNRLFSGSFRLGDLRQRLPASII
jgi:hypothetical protein